MNGGTVWTAFLWLPRVHRRRCVSLVDRLGETLGLGPHIAPDTAIAPKSRELHDVVHPVFIRDVPEQDMPQDMRGDLEVLLQREGGVACRALRRRMTNAWVQSSRLPLQVRKIGPPRPSVR
jgi:hypothetical protein